MFLTQAHIHSHVPLHIAKRLLRADFCFDPGDTFVSPVADLVSQAGHHIQLPGIEDDITGSLCRVVKSAAAVVGFTFPDPILAP